jgi:hypothetical protein
MKKPTLEEIDAYIQKNGSLVDAIRFFNHYESTAHEKTGEWIVGPKKPMTNWRSAIGLWDRNEQLKRGQNAKPDRFREAIERSREDDRQDEGVQQFQARPGSRVSEGVQAHDRGVRRIEGQPRFRFSD